MSLKLEPEHRSQTKFLTNKTNQVWKCNCSKNTKISIKINKFLKQNFLLYYLVLVKFFPFDSYSTLPNTPKEIVSLINNLLFY